MIGSRFHNSQLTLKSSQHNLKANPMGSRRSISNAAILTILAGWIAVGSGVAEAADAVYRKSNSTPAQGTVTSVSRTEIKVKPRIGDEITVPISDVERVRWDGEPAGLNLARSNELAGNFEKALEGYAKAATDYAGNNKNLTSDLEFLVARTTAKAALADPALLPEASTLLEKFRTDNSQSFRYFECVYYLGEVYMAAKDFAQARTAFDELRQSPLKAYQMMSNVSNARLLLAEGKLAQARALFAEVAGEQASTPAELSRKYEAMLGKAACEQQAQQYGDAIKTLESVVEVVPPTDTKTLAEAYVLLGDCYRDQNKIKEAVLAYLHVDVLFANEKTVHPEALYGLARLWASAGHPERGAEAEARLEANYPNNEWTQRLTSGTN